MNNPGFEGYGKKSTGPSSFDLVIVLGHGDATRGTIDARLADPLRSGLSDNSAERELQEDLMQRLKGGEGPCLRH